MYWAFQKQHNIYKYLTISCNLIESHNSEQHTFHDKQSFVFLSADGAGRLDCNARRQLSFKTKRLDCIFDKEGTFYHKKDSRRGLYVQNDTCVSYEPNTITRIKNKNLLPL